MAPHRPNHPWNQEQRELLTDLVAFQDDYTIANYFGTSEKAIQEQRRRLGLFRDGRDIWSEEKTAELRQLFADGWSAGAIAQKWGVSRNTVVGKKYRLGICSAKKPNRELPRGPKGPLGYRRKSPELRVVFTLPREPDPSLGIGLFDLKENHCRWPSGTGPYTFCGNEKITGCSYCEYHFRVAHTPDPQEPRSRKKLPGRFIVERAA